MMYFDLYQSVKDLRQILPRVPLAINHQNAVHYRPQAMRNNLALLAGFITILPFR